MPIAYLLEWPGVSQEQYDAVMEKLGGYGSLAPGGLFHAAGPSQDGWRVIEAWETKEAFEEFVTKRLGPALQEVGLGLPPQPRAWPVHKMLK